MRPSHWKNAGLGPAIPQPYTAGLHGFYQPDSFRVIKFSSRVSQKKDSYYVFAEYQKRDYPIGSQWIDTHESGLQADKIET